MTEATGNADSERATNDDSAPIDDPKEQMRIALERKKQQSVSGQAHLDGHAKATGEHSKEGGGRQFRRKSG